MILGIGTDIIEVKRMEKSISNGTRFREKIFSEHEQKYCETKKNKFQNYGGRFAAKEAFFKAVGTGYRGGIGFSDIEIINDELGKPEIVFSEKAEEFYKELKIKKIHVTITHIKEYASANVVIEI